MTFKNKNVNIILVRHGSVEKTNVVIIAKRIHLFPFRTQKLSSITPKVVAGSLAARIGRCDAVHRKCSEKSAFALYKERERKISERCPSLAEGAWLETM